MPKLLPDRNGIAYVKSSVSNRPENWTLDLETNVPQQLDIGGHQSAAMWSRNGRRFAYSILRGGWNVYVRSAGSSEDTQLTATDHFNHVTSWSADGELLVFTEASSDTGDSDIWIVRADGSEDPQLLIATPANEDQATFSPNGRWIAYRSDRSGQHDILVAPFPSSEAPKTVSADGGTEPVWSKDGRELYYRTDDVLMAVPVSDGPELEPGRPVLVFEDHFLRTGGEQESANYDVAPDGRFLMLSPAEGDGTSLVVVLNWFEELKRLVPTE